MGGSMSIKSQYAVPRAEQGARVRTAGVGLAAGARLDWALALVVGAAAFALQAIELRGVGLWEDEAFSVGIARQPLATQLHYIWSKEVNMTLYYLILRAWLGLTGLLGIPASEFVVRLPSTLFAALAAVAVFALGRRFWGRTAGLVAAALYLLNYLQLMMAGQARGYGLQLLLLTLSWYALLAGLTAGARAGRAGRWYALYVGTMVLALGAHLESVLVLLAQAMTLAVLLVAPGPWREAVRRSSRALSVNLGLVLLFIVFIALDVKVHGSSNNQLGPASLAGLLRLGWHIGGQNPVYALLLAAACAVGVAATLRLPLGAPPGAPDRAADGAGARGVTALGWKTGTLRPAWYPGLTLALLSWLLAPIVLAYVLSQRRFNVHLFADYLVIVVPALCLLGGVGVAALPGLLRGRLSGNMGGARASWAAGLVLVIVALPVIRLYHTDARRQDFSGAARWMQGQYRPGDGVVFLSTSSALVMSYYLDSYLGQGRLAAESPGAWSWTQDDPTPFDSAALDAYSRRHGRLFLVDASQDGQAPLAQSENTLTRGWLAANRYRYLSSVETSAYYGSVTVQLYAPPR